MELHETKDLSLTEKEARNVKVPLLKRNFIIHVINETKLVQQPAVWRFPKTTECVWNYIKRRTFL